MQSCSCLRKPGALYTKEQETRNGIKSWFLYFRKKKKKLIIPYEVWMQIAKDVASYSLYNLGFEVELA